jgi:hypothetical protein
MRSALLLAIIVLVGTVSSVAAQQTSSLQHRWVAISVDEDATFVVTSSAVVVLPSEFVLQEALTRAAAPRWSRGQATLAGMGIGALAGLAAFAIQGNGCWRQGDSMCELAIPIYVGAGAAAGGLIGYMLGSQSQ